MPGIELDNQPSEVRSMRARIRAVSYTPEPLLEAWERITPGDDPGDDVRMRFRARIAERFLPNRLPPHYYDIGQESVLTQPGDRIEKYMFTNPHILQERYKGLQRGYETYVRHFGDLVVDQTVELAEVPFGWRKWLKYNSMVRITMPHLHLAGNALARIIEDPSLLEDRVNPEDIQRVADGIRAMMREGDMVPDISPRVNNLVLTEEGRGLSVIDVSPFFYRGKIKPAKKIYQKRAIKAADALERALEVQ